MDEIQKIATAEIAKEIWDTLPIPTCVLVREALINQGYKTPGLRSVNKWKAKGKWPKPELAKQPRRARGALEETQPHQVKERVGRPTATNQAIVEVLAKAVDEKIETMQPEERNALQDVMARADKEWVEAASDEDRMRMLSMTAMKCANKYFVLIEFFGPELIQSHPEAAGKCFQAISAGVVTATDPIEKIVAMRTSTMKTLVPQPNGKLAEVIHAEEYDPLAESFKAHFVNGARA